MIIPGKLTNLLQPLDVVINGPFKKYLREEWNNQFKKGEEGRKYYTKMNRRKKPSYQVR